MSIIVGLVERSAQQAPNHLVSMECVNPVPSGTHFVKESVSTLIQTSNTVVLVETSVQVRNHLVVLAYVNLAILKKNSVMESVGLRDWLPSVIFGLLITVVVVASSAKDLIRAVLCILR
jgi:hypothetical protein